VRTRVRSLLGYTLAAVGTLMVLLLAGGAYVALVGVTVEAPGLRDRLAAELADRLGRAVSFDGTVSLHLSADPWVRVQGLRISDPSDFGSGDFVQVGEARLALDLKPLLTQRVLHVRDLSGGDVRVNLRSRPDGRNNWTFAIAAGRGPTRPGDEPASPAANGPSATAANGPTAPAANGPTAPGGAPAAWAMAGVHLPSISLRRLTIEYDAGDGRPHFFDLDSMDAQAQRGGALQAVLRGTVEKRFPYELTVDGGPLGDLPWLGARLDSPWPLVLDLSFLGSALRVEGQVARAPEGVTGQLVFGLGTPDLSEIERLLGAELPRVGATAIAGTIVVEPDRVSLKSLVGSMGQTALTGNLELVRGPIRPRVTGALALPTLDMRPFLRQEVKPDAAPALTLAQWYRDIAQAHFSLADLTRTDVDVELRVDHWLSLPGDVSDAVVRLQIDAGRLSAPIRASVAGVVLSGDLRADGAAATPSFELTLGARDSGLGDLAELLFGLRGLNGALGGFALRAAAEGDEVGELVRSLDVRVVVARAGLTYGNPVSRSGAADPDARPVAFGLDSLVLTLPAGRPLSVQVQGSLLEQPLSATLHGAPLEALMSGVTPIDASVVSRSLRAHVRGTLDAPSATTGPDLAFSVKADRAADATRWLKLQAGASLPLAIEGKARWRAAEWAVSDTTLRLGRNVLALDLSQTRPRVTPPAPRGQAVRAGRAALDGRASAAPRPLLTLRLAADTLDLGELDSVVPRAPSPSAPARAVLDIPILPAGIDLSDANVQVTVQRVAGSALDVSDLRFEAQMRDGQLLASPFSAKVLGASFDGAIALDLRGAEPRAELWLGAEGVDVGQMLRRLALAQTIEASAGRLVVHGVARGSRLGDLLVRSELLGEITAGRVALRDRNTGARADIALDKGTLRADAGAPLRLSLDGGLDGVPIGIELQSGTLVELAQTDRPVPFALRATTAQATLRIDGRLARPVTDRAATFALNLEGPRVDSLSRLARVSLPPWGPYALSGRLAVSNRGYEVADMSLRVGRSELRGRGSLDTTVAPPRIDVLLESPTVQLDDFRLGDWWPVERKPAAASAPMTVEQVRARALEASEQAGRLLSPEVLRRQDASLVVRVERVQSGADTLGSGWLIAKVEQGRADVGPVQVDVPGGRASLWLSYAPTERDVAAQVRVKVDAFDYGVLARRIMPKTDLRGLFSLDVDVSGRAPTLARVMEHGQGTIDFSVWPENLRAGVFDLWAANLFVALAERVDPSSSSKVNCAIGRFVLSDGVLTERQILLDTTRVRVQGKGQVAFRDERVELKLQPRPKQAQFFSLATPIGVQGSFRDYRIGVDAADVLATLGSFATSLLWVPVQKLAGDEVPADGRDVCRRADLP